ALGRRRLLEGADRRPERVQGARVPGAEPGLLDLARQGGGPARRPHRRRAGRGVRDTGLRRGALPGRGGRDAGRREGLLGRPGGRPPGRQDCAVSTVVEAEVRRAGRPAEYFLGWDHVELWVGNARAFAAFLASAFGFGVTSYAGPETGVVDRVSYVLEQGSVRFVVTGALRPDSPVARSVRAHGDGVHDLAVSVSDAPGCYQAALARGAAGLHGPWVAKDDS